MWRQVRNMNWEMLERKVKNSIDLTDEDLTSLLEREQDEDLRRLYSLANEVNQRLNGDTVSFIHNMNMNYTNICEYLCTFCEFKKSADSNEAYILNFEDVKRRIGQAEGELSEITVQGGLSREVKFGEVLSLLREIRAAFPKLHFHAFSPEEIDYYAKETGESYASIILKARDAGMDSMCGTAAEVLDERIRRKICSDKASSEVWVEIIKTGHRLGLQSTATILFGHIEKSEHVVQHLQKIRAIQRETHGFTEFIPLLFMPDKTKLGRAIDPSMDRIVYAFKMIAVSRLYFMNDIRNIQTSWVKLGWDNALKSLSYGANDMSGTLYNENITREAGGENGEYVSLNQFYSELRRIGKTPVQRDTLYSYQREDHRSNGDLKRRSNADPICIPH
jgi:7,8-didemethyl-8-hydroxy-5-deazariboflavin synthase CofH subunit